MVSGDQVGFRHLRAAFQRSKIHFNYNYDFNAIKKLASKWPRYNSDLQQIENAFKDRIAHRIS